MIGLIMKMTGKIHWTWAKYMFTGRTYDLRPCDRETARALMKEGIYLWVSRRDTHLSTYAIALADWILSFWTWFKTGRKGFRPRFGFWAHAFVNYDDNEIVEAVGKGVQKVFFDDVFDCDSCAALVPRNISADQWAKIRMEIVQELEAQIGKKYDSKFNIEDESTVSCIELVRLVLKKRVKEYHLKFRHFEYMIGKYKNVTPQMLYESKDFVVVWERKA